MTVQHKKHISFVIPAYKEEHYLSQTMLQLHSECKDLSDRYFFEIIIVNDGSPDGTR